eukprot:gnl/TRDRNA2_/TRDRNA2_196864_c0_seq1.p1 gnl/TRDRNA2_/TRDRNA2_196864_c0~~gnl/TRDRNA2_/TRDRNA2_196864_c0_seq1.p1  ORF type:complete len:414 (+),score=72.24 gnl/TRDRNA2_/TRDRNA2_196864_c0_seq1:56-1243(+)
MAAPAAARSGVYFCRQPARCVTTLPGADQGRHRFLVGTCALQQRNEIHSVEFCEATAEVICRQVFGHEDEITLLAAGPSTSAGSPLLLTYSGGGRASPQLRLWRTPPESASGGGSDGDSAEQLQLVSNVADESTGEAPLASVKSILWDPHNEGNIVVADTEALHIFQGSGSGGNSAARTFSRLLTLNVGQRCSGACMDPHHPQQVSTVDDAHLKTWDLRSQKLAFKKDGVHLFGARDVDYNPNAPYQVVTAGEDSTLRFWDLRQLSSCRATLKGGHHHWVARARFNCHHDQLVLSCGTDSAVCLWRALSVASAPLGGSGAGGGAGEAANTSGGGAAAGNTTAPKDGLVKRFEEHEDSVYSCCWSAADAWVFASVSFDGKLVVGRVPDEEKYRILL